MNTMGDLLVVDDDPETNELLAAVLERAGHRVRRAYDGADALAQMLGSGPPDVVLLDIDMPVMNGVECARRMGLHPQLAEVAIVICSGADRAILDGMPRADASFAKPVDVPLLLAELSRLVGRRRARVREA